MRKEKLDAISLEQTAAELTKDDLLQVVAFTNKCIACSSKAAFDNILLSLADLVQFEFVLYCYTPQSYDNERSVCWVNLSNPEEWDAEYKREGYLSHDPVRCEMERIMATGARYGFMLWDDYEWDLSPMEKKVVERREHYGLQYGFSTFVDSEKKDFTFLFSFASQKTRVGKREKVLSSLLLPHLMVARKRLDVQVLIQTLSDKEKVVSDWISEGKTNWEIAKILDVTENTVKFHIKNIFAKLQVANRQQAIAILLAERYLSV